MNADMIEVEPGLTASMTESVHLLITDAEVLAELRRLPSGAARQRLALDALRIGVLSMRAASGELDARTIRDAGKQVVLEIQGLLSERAASLTSEVASSLARYFDPATGLATRKLEDLTQDGGEIERVLRQHIGDESTLARTLAAHVGEHSPLYRMLSADDANGVRAQIEATIEAALRLQAEQVLRQFSLDHEDSALSRLVREVTSVQDATSADMKRQVQAVVGEFSLDRPLGAVAARQSDRGRAEADLRRVLA